MLQDSNRVSYQVTGHFLFCGKVGTLDADSGFIIGPGYNIPLTHGHLNRIMMDSSIPHPYLAEFEEFLSEIPLISFESFLNALCFLNFSLSRTRVSVEELLLLGNKFHSFGTDIKHNLTEALYDSDEALYRHGTYNLEQQMLAYVRGGDTDKLSALFENSVRSKAGTIAKDTLRQEKNIFIISSTLVTRAAIEGGLDVETAYQLSDIYIQQAEGISLVDSLSLLRQQMVLDFAERVAKNKLPSNASSVTIKCIQYIKKNINTILLVHDIARDLGVSASYISSKFIKDTGISLNTFINMEKLEEAKRLLAFSDKSLSEISSYLCFSSQSYFQNLFKKHVGMTPLKYRNTSRNRT
ncbi:helix-turn-helix domain-containing protein [Paenibacillus sinensis]|uniref:helix-turn-helix domain-containing protein n=1 Tax=Paenibacillus sinensis TaxID=2834413 RepID=UPI001CA8644D|nr:helix-turn-helix domain-containing protein [Paenibacillus sinensis]